MNTPIIQTNTSDATDIEKHLLECDLRFIHPLSQRVNIREYAVKLSALADRFEAWDRNRLIGLVAAYIENSNKIEGFVSSVSICGEFEGQGIASVLMKRCISTACVNGLTALSLEVADQDERASAFYRKHGFHAIGSRNSDYTQMSLQIKIT